MAFDRLTTLIVPGLQDSGPGHWQSLWQADHPEWQRIGLRDWARPDLDAWTQAVFTAIRAAPGRVRLVAHSFGCLASVRAASFIGHRVAAAFLVAPADPDKFEVASWLTRTMLPFPSAIVASRDDPWMSYEKVSNWSVLWGSRLIDLGNAGHINADSGYGPWPEGERLLNELMPAKLRPSSGIMETVLPSPMRPDITVKRTSR